MTEITLGDMRSLRKRHGVRSLPRLCLGQTANGAVFDPREFIMRYLEKSVLRRSALLAAFLVPTLSACAGSDLVSVGPDWFANDHSPYYANVTNPVPELSGQRIARSDVRIYATPVNPHPELMGFPDVEIANAPATTQVR